MYKKFKPQKGDSLKYLFKKMKEMCPVFNPAALFLLLLCKHYLQRWKTHREMIRLTLLYVHSGDDNSYVTCRHPVRTAT